MSASLPQKSTTNFTGVNNSKLPAENSSASFERLVQVVAAGQCPFPTDLSPQDAERLCAEVQQLRRSRLVRLIAREIACDFEKNHHQKKADK